MSNLPAPIIAKCDDIVARFNKLEVQLGSQEVAGNHRTFQELAKQRSEFEPVVKLYREYQAAQNSLKEAQELLASSTDADMKELASEEINTLTPKLPDLEKKIKLALVPKDPLDAKNIIVELRPGAGGDEAGLFAGDAFRMYSKYAEIRRWKLEVLEANRTGVGGYKEVIFSVAGDGVYGRMKFESGVHRVQRVPATETQGRIHTSTITVAVMPEAEEIDVQIKEADLKIDVYRSSGPGGQSVNTTDSAVRITHLPTGVVVTCQDEKSQLKNKAKALRVLRARLLDTEKAKQDAERSKERKSQIGTGDRSERIRTYNFPQGRLTDHRINLTIYQLQSVMDGNIDEILDALQMADQEERLAEV